MEYSFCVAGFLFTVCLPEEQSAWALLPSFRPFFHKGEPHEEKIFDFKVSSDPLPEVIDNAVLIEEMNNDMGFVRLFRLADAYRVEMRHMADSAVHYMHVRHDFTSAVATIYWDDPYAGHVLDSLLRLVYSQALLAHQAVSVHASSVVFEGKAYLFTGKSGTGKSTHSSLWMKYLPACELLNDDNPTIRLKDGILIACGTPWSGKTACYKNSCFPLGGIVRLHQAKENRFVVCKEIEAFASVLPACLCISVDTDLHRALCDFLIDATNRTLIGELNCLPNREALAVCLEGLGLSNMNMK